MCEEWAWCDRSKPTQFQTKVTRVTVPEGGGVLFGPALTVRDSETVNQTVFKKLRVNLRKRGETVLVKEVRTEKLHES